MIEVMIGQIFILFWSFFAARELHWYISGGYKNKKGWIHLMIAIGCLASMLKSWFT